MSHRDWRLYIQDILDAIAAIQDYTAGMDFPSFQRDRKTVDAVLRNVTVIGEAAGRIPDKIQAHFLRSERNIESSDQPYDHFVPPYHEWERGLGC